MESFNWIGKVSKLVFYALSTGAVISGWWIGKEFTEIHNFEYQRLSDAAVTFKCEHGKWTLYESVELSENYHHAKFAMYQLWRLRKS